jgi:hypothetical protein
MLDAGACGSTPTWRVEVSPSRRTWTMMDALQVAGPDRDGAAGVLLDAGTERLRQILLEGAADQSIDAWGDLDA